VTNFDYLMKPSNQHTHATYVKATGSIYS